MNKYSLSMIKLYVMVIFLCTRSFVYSHVAPLEIVKEPKYELVICAIFQNEDFFLKEWIEFHRLMGVQHFYLYNNLSDDNYKQILKPYIKAGLVDLYQIPIRTHNQKEHSSEVQIPAYKHALHLAKQSARWIAFIDLDEFLVPVNHSDLTSLLAEYTDYAGLLVNWQAYGTSGINSIPPGELFLQHLVLKASTDAECNRMHKSIVQPRYVSAIRDPHYFRYEPNYYAVNSNKELTGPGSSVVVDKIRLNHYWFGTRDWFVQNKLPRRAKWGLDLPAEQVDPLIATCNQVWDGTILRFIDSLKSQMTQELPRKKRR